MGQANIKRQSLHWVVPSDNHVVNPPDTLIITLPKQCTPIQKYILNWAITQFLQKTQTDEYLQYFKDDQLRFLCDTISNSFLNSVDENIRNDSQHNRGILIATKAVVRRLKRINYKEPY